VIFSGSHAIDLIAAMMTLPHRLPFVAKWTLSPKDNGSANHMRRNSQGDYGHSQTIQSAAADTDRTARQR